MTKQYKQLIGGKWVDSVSGETFESKNPSTGEVLASVPYGDERLTRSCYR